MNMCEFVNLVESKWIKVCLIEDMKMIVNDS